MNEYKATSSELDPEVGTLEDPDEGRAKSTSVNEKNCMVQCSKVEKF